MKPADVVSRAHGAIGHGCLYKLGKGGFNPASPVPWNSHGECDCSGFAAWCLGFPRHVDHPWYVQQNGGWIETTQIVKDALSPFGFFQGVAWEQAAPGDLIVYGDKDGHQGHVGVVSEVDEHGPIGVIHCSHGNFNSFKDAIQPGGLATVGFFKMHDALIARAAGVV